MEFHRILTPVSGQDADEEAIKLACQLGKRSKAKICVVYVIQIKRALPLDAESESEIQKGEKVLDWAKGIAKERGYKVETELLQARDIGHAIVDEIMERNIDLLVMGGPYRRQFGEFTFGDIAPYVLKEAPCHLVLYREPIGDYLK